MLLKLTSDRDLEEIRSSYQSGESASSIAARLGVSAPTILVRLGLLGIETRTAIEARRALAERCDLRALFERHVHHEPNSGCHLWDGVPNHFGYGRIGPKRRLAHRVAWELYRGKIPAGVFVLHSCDVPSCVNPDHLWLGTKGDNGNDMARKNRGVRGRLPFGVRPSGATSSRFSAGFQFRRRWIYLGTYATPEEASAIAIAEKRRLRGLPPLTVDPTDAQASVDIEEAAT